MSFYQVNITGLFKYILNLVVHWVVTATIAGNLVSKYENLVAQYF